MDMAHPLQRRYHGSASIKEYDFIAKLGEGTFGWVHRLIRAGQQDRKDVKADPAPQ